MESEKDMGILAVEDWWMQPGYLEICNAICADRARDRAFAETLPAN